MKTDESVGALFRRIRLFQITLQRWECEPFNSLQPSKLSRKTFCPQMECGKLDKISYLKIGF